MKVYLDNCCYNRPYDDQSQILISLETQAKLYIQELIRKKKIELVTSFILWYELSQNPMEMRKRAIMDFIRSNSSQFISSDSGKSIRTRAEHIMETGVKMKDAYNVACAVEAECHYFISTDKRLLKYRSPEIVLCNPIEFVREIGGAYGE